MATQAKVDSQQQDADALVITGAAMVGAGNGVKKVINDKAELAENLIKPGDQRHIAHPVDELVTDVKNLASDVSAAWDAVKTPGDMRIENQPHPVDQAMQARNDAISATTRIFEEKGVVDGTYAFSAVAAGVVVENAISPSGKLHAVEAVVDVAGGVNTATKASKTIHGEYIAASEANKAIATLQATIEPAGKATLKDKILNNPTVKMFTDVVSPPLDTRIALEAKKARPGMFDHIDETHRPGGDIDALHAQSDDRILRAEKLAEVIRSNPALMAQNSNITDAQIRALVHDTSSDAQLGLEHNTKSVPRLLSPEEQQSVNAHIEKIASAKQAIADEKTYQDSLPLVKKILRKVEMDNANPDSGFAIGIGRYGGTKNDHMAIAAAEKESEQLKIMAKSGLRGAITVAGVAKVLAMIALADDKPIDKKSIGRPMSENEKLALSFVNVHLGKGTPEEKVAAMKQLQTPHPSEINSAVDVYLKLQSHLTQDGQLSTQDATALKVATANITGKLAAGEPIVAIDQQVTNTANLQLEQMR